MADIKISALPTATSVNDADIFVMDQSLVTKTATRAQILASIKDANNNITANAFFNNLASITASGTPVVLTVASAPVSLVTGSGGQVIKLPDATTLTNGTIFSFNNNQSSGAISVNNNSNTLVVSVPSGGYTTVVLLSNATAAGSWDRHDQTPANVSWSTNTFDYPGSITSATWNGNAVAINRGGTGATSQAAALIALAAMATSERATYATTTQVAAITASSLGALSTAQAVTIAQGGTGQTSQQAALNAIAGAVTANQVLKGNGTNVVLGALTSADIPTLPIAKLSGVAASGANTDLTSVALTTGTVSTTPSGVTDIVNKAYADSIGSGINFHDACDYGTLAALSPTATYNQPGGAGVGVNATLTGQTNIALQVDGVTVAVGKRILVKNQASAFQNGVYNVTQQGDGSTVPYILTRAADYDTSGSGTNEVQAGDFILILSSTLANTAWVQQTPAPINFGVTSISFTQFAAAAAGVSSFNTSLTGLTPSTNTTGAVTLAGTLGVASGGTGAATLTGLVKGTGTTAMVAATAGTDYVVPSGNITGTASNVTGIVAIANGGSGQSTQAAAITALTGTQTSGRYLRSDGTNAALAAIQAGDVPTLNQNTSGTAAGLSSTLAVTSGGTGQTAYTDGQLLIGNTATGGLSKATITAGSNVTVTNGNGTITIAAGASGVSSFSAGTTGLTPNTATTGAVSLGGTLAIANGGSGATTAGDARANLGGIQPVTVRSTSNVLPATAGTLTAAVWTQGSAVITFTSSSITPVIGMSINIGVAAGVIKTVDSPTQITMSSVAGGSGSGAIVLYNSTLTTLVTASLLTVDGKTLAIGDTIILVQTALAQSGPWVVSSIGSGVSLTRPSWFTGSITTPLLALITSGTGQQGALLSIGLAAGATGTQIGVESLTVGLVASRGNTNAVLGGNTFVGKNTFQAGTAGSGAVPFAFQAGTLMTTPQAHSVEWDSTQMYVTNSSAERLPVATSKVQLNAQTGTTYTLALADAGYSVTLNNASAIALTVPTNATVAFPIGTQILVMQLGAGQVTVSGASVTFNAKNGLKTSGQYAVICLIKIATDTWILSGDAAV